MLILKEERKRLGILVRERKAKRYLTRMLQEEEEARREPKDLNKLWRRAVDVNDPYNRVEAYLKPKEIQYDWHLSTRAFKQHLMHYVHSDFKVTIPRVHPFIVWLFGDWRRPEEYRPRDHMPEVDSHRKELNRWVDHTSDTYRMARLMNYAQDSEAADMRL